MTSAENGFLGWVSGSIPTSDYSMIMLERLVPAAFGIGSSDILALSDAMKIFNAGLLMLASLSVGWHLLQGVVSTAHDGKVLGSRWHQIWAPARVVLGLGMLTPLSSGFCLAQILVLQISVWGIGFADAVWSEYSDSVSKGKVVSYNSIPSSYDSLRGIWLLEVCRAGAREIAFENNFSLEDVETQSFFGSFLTHKTQPVLETPQRRVINNGQVREYVWDYGPFCGEVRFKVPTAGASLLENKALADVILTSASGARVDITPARRALETVKVRAVESAQMALRRHAEVFVNPEKKPTEKISAADLRAIIEPIRAGYDKAVYSAVVTASDAIDGSARDAFREDAKKTGWATASTYYLSISRMSKEILEEVNRRPTASLSELENAKIWDTRHPVIGQTIRTQKIADELWKNAVPHHHEIGGKSMTVAGDKSMIDDMLSYLVLGSDQPGGGMLSLFDMAESTDPMASMISAGHGILSTLWIGLGIIIGGSILTGAAGIILGMVAGGGIVTTIVMSIFFVLLGVGSFYAYILPVMPFTLFYFGVLGWLLFVAEALVAAPIWALFHCRMDGDTLIGDTQKAGYMLLFSLLMRPVLMLIGLLLGFSIFNI